MSGPTIAIVGGSGYVGKTLTNAFINALNQGRIKEIRVLTARKPQIVQEFEKNGAKIHIVDFANNESIVSAFSNADVVVSTLGTGKGTNEVKKALMTALVDAGIKIYFPSEFGTNHYTRCKDYKHPIFEGKKEHFNEAKANGIKAIRILCGDIMEGTFGIWLGLDNKAEVWSLVGKGEVPVAMTAERDIGRFTVEAVLMAFKDPASIPDLIEIYSDMRTMKGYAEAFDKVAGRKTQREHTSLSDAVANYNSTKSFEYLLQILFEEGAYDYTDSTGNELLNPGQSLWKLKTIEEYAEETGGRPWKDYEYEGNKD